MDTDSNDREIIEIAEALHKDLLYNNTPKGQSIALMIIASSNCPIKSQALIQNLVCPITLEDLRYEQRAKNEGRLVAEKSGHEYLVVDGFPVMLVNDENWQKKRDELIGEHEFNVNTVPQHVHKDRVRYINRNADLFFDAIDLDLKGKTVLSVGCSFSELHHLNPKGCYTVCLDIAPSLGEQSHQSTRSQSLNGSWVCADGECIPFQNEAFDVVVIRQAIHHMLKYYSAISEFFRVCKLDGRILLIDEPMAGFDPSSFSFPHYSDTKLIYDGVTLGDVRQRYQMEPGKTNAAIEEANIDLDSMERKVEYQEADPDDAESLLAEKYYSLTLIHTLFHIQLHSDDLLLYFPEKRGGAEGEGENMRFFTKDQAINGLPMLDKLTAQSPFVSIKSVKTRPTRILRSRENLSPAPFDDIRQALALNK